MIKKTIIRLLGGFADLDEAIQHIRDIDNKKMKAKILQEYVKKLYNCIDVDDILRKTPEGGWLFKGKPLTDAEVSQLKEQATFILKSRLWKVIRLDVQYQLGKKMFQEARVPEDILWGQLLTFLDDIIQTRLRRMK